MRLKNYLSTVIGLFLVIGILHFVRAFTTTKAMIGQTEIPIWASWLAVVVAFYLCYQGYKLRS